MGAAFKCDLCDDLHEGSPDQTVTVAPRQGPNTTRQLCPLCLASFNDWVASRVPEHDRPEATT